MLMNARNRMTQRIMRRAWRQQALEHQRLLHFIIDPFGVAGREFNAGQQIYDETAVHVAILKHGAASDKGHIAEPKLAALFRANHWRRGRRIAKIGPPKIVVLDRNVEIDAEPT